MEANINNSTNTLDVLSSYGMLQVSKLLTEGTKIYIPEHPKHIRICEKSIMDFCKSLIDWEKSRIILFPEPHTPPCPFIDGRLWRDENLGGKIILGFEKGFNSTVYRYNFADLVINSENIINKAVETGAIRIYNNLEALCITDQAVRKGEVDEIGKVLSIYFQSGNFIFRLHLCRRSNGRLCIYVFQDNPKGEFYVGSGVCF